MWKDLHLVVTTTMVSASEYPSHWSHTLPKFILSTTVTHTVFYTLYPYYEPSVAGTIVLYVTLRYQVWKACIQAAQVLGHYSKVLLWIYSCQKSVRSTVSSNAWLQEITSYKYLCTIILRHLKKIYSHAGQYAKITYKISLSLSKIVFIQGFFSRNNGANV